MQSSSGLFLPPKQRRYSEPIALDLYAGCGGFSLGIKQAGFHVVGAVEWWPAAAETYLYNLGSAETKLHMGRTPSDEAGKKLAKHWEKIAGTTVLAKDFFPSAGGNQLSTATEHFWLSDVSELTGNEILEALVGCSGLSSLLK
ncbi:MAG TPA: DNA cytosine methyltransferase, partial [Phycisphaerales bacterium]|nr:DNA cytosine methyltransferase [Phycisphaerales bacterium]